MVERKQKPPMRCDPKPIIPLNLGITNCYLLRSARGYLLVDTAYAGNYGRFLKAIAALGVDPREIRHLLLTHHHDDHAGFARRLRDQSGCTIIAHRRAVAPLGRGESEESMKPLNNCIRFVFALFRGIHGGFRYPPVILTDRDIIIEGDDEETLHRIGIDGAILHTPGHSQDSISIVLRDGSAIVGDAAMNFLNFCRIRYRPIFVEDLEAVYESWNKLLRHGARIVYPAHGGYFAAEKLSRLAADRWPDNPKGEETYWSRFAATYDAGGEYVVGARIIQRIEQQLAAEEPVGEALELGCGTGYFTTVIAGNSGHITATDLSEPMLQAARSRLQNLSNVTVQKADCTASGFADARFDAVFVINLVHVLEDPPRCLRECARVLREHGRLIVVDLTSFRMALLRKIGLGLRYLRTWGPPPRGGKNDLSPEELSSLVEEAGFQVDSIRLLQEQANALYLCATRAQ